MRKEKKKPYTHTAVGLISLLVHAIFYEHHLFSFGGCGAHSTLYTFISTARMCVVISHPSCSTHAACLQKKNLCCFQCVCNDVRTAQVVLVKYHYI